MLQCHSPKSSHPLPLPLSPKVGPMILIPSIAKGILQESLGCGFPGGKIILDYFSGPPVESSGRDPTCQCRRRRRLGLCPRVGKIPWRREWHPTPVFLPGTSHGQRSLAGYSPRSRQKLDATEHAHANRAKRALKSEREGGQEKGHLLLGAGRRR